MATEDLAPASWLKRRYDAFIMRRWKAQGRRTPPPHVFKRELVNHYANRFSARVFIETGTFYGDMISAVLNRFHQIISVELDERLHQLARRRFNRYPNVRLLLGDSAILLPQVLASINASCLFWLDAHYSGARTAFAALETPILTELRCVLARKAPQDVILIDDARLFNGSHDYPRLDEIKALASQLSTTHHVIVSNDVIQIYPR